MGVAGFIQGCGFGSFSKRFGLGAAHLIQAEVVTADGRIRAVDESLDPDLFWALKGGGGGTFGVVTRLTLRTHPLPSTFGVVQWKVKASDDDAFRALLDRFIALYSETMFNPHWGEQACAGPGNVFDVTMLFQGLDEPAARAAWAELVAFVGADPAYTVESPLIVAAMPARDLWNPMVMEKALPGVMTLDDRPGAAGNHWWWTTNVAEVGAFWHGYESAWLPAALIGPQERSRSIDAWFSASRHWSTSLHFNKGLAGADPDAIAASRATAMNPQVHDAFALAIEASEGKPALNGHSDADVGIARANHQAIKQAMAALRACAPNAGAYVSECDYDLTDWRTACWGEHVARLEEIKRRYDPDGLFIVHHGIESDRWS